MKRIYVYSRNGMDRVPSRAASGSTAPQGDHVFHMKKLPACSWRHRYYAAAAAP